MQGLLHGCANQNASVRILKYGSKQIECVSTQQNINQTYDRTKLKLSVKLFVDPNLQSLEAGGNFQSDVLTESIESVVQLLDAQYIDNLILSIQTDNQDNVMPNLKSFWTSCEKYISENKARVHFLGTSDLSADQLKELYEWAPTIKPSSSQINLDACCDIPADLSAFTKSKSILLFTHNDPLCK